MTDLVSKAHDKGLEVWGWQVPHCATTQTAQAEAKVFGELAKRFQLDGLIMDAEGGPDFFHGGVDEARDYGNAMREVERSKRPLGISSNDIPQNLPGGCRNSTRLRLRPTSIFHRPITGRARA